VSFSARDRDKEFCRSIVEAFNYLERYIEGVSKIEFLADPKTQDATAMRLQQILECATKLSPEAKSRLQIAWPSLVAMRNKISHSYVDVDAEIVWEVIQGLDEFKKLIEWSKMNI